ncbi:hypothetical protein SB3_08725 [Methylobacterium radiotolerans]|nr:hypothetical protein SB3_08725 [Methylobacterium radiotolerans]
MSKRLSEGLGDIWVSGRTYASERPPAGTIQRANSAAGASGLTMLSAKDLRFIVEREIGDHNEAEAWARLSCSGRYAEAGCFWGFEIADDAFAFRMRFT